MKSKNAYRKGISFNTDLARLETPTAADICQTDCPVFEICRAKRPQLSTAYDPGMGGFSITVQVDGKLAGTKDCRLEMQSAYRKVLAL